MNRLVLIGNGFDLAHGLKTSYADFINWYWLKRAWGLYDEHSNISKDALCTFEVKDKTWWHTILSHYLHEIREDGKGFIDGILENTQDFHVSFSPLFNNICKGIETKGWVDIENEYYELLKNCTLDVQIENLNKELRFLQDKLVEYLNEMKITEDMKIKDIEEKIYAPINPSDIAIGGKNALNAHSERKRPYKFMLLNFNYTKTAELYAKKNFVPINQIHGTLETPDSIIFGYGDEMDNGYKELLNKNDNRLLRNIKSIKYLEADNYRKMLSFIEAEPFQVLIMGHSCGNSDRTLLNTLFEHPNCVSIKPYYYVDKKGKDNYLDIVQNISRNFTDMKLMRDRVVNKTYCEPLPQAAEDNE